MKVLGSLKNYEIPDLAINHAFLVTLEMAFNIWALFFCLIYTMNGSSVGKP